MNILAIETSCDETAVAVVKLLDNGLVAVEAEAIATSDEMHKQTGGVVPEVAAREQLVSIMPVITACIHTAAANNHTVVENDGLSKWVNEHIDGIAVTQGPGLIGSLLVGVETAKALALAWNKPLMGVNHLLGHVYANWLDAGTQKDQPTPLFPALALIVSGGHTELILLNNHGDYELIGATRDDAAGECFDKCARLFGYGYPGGPAISTLASRYEVQNSDDGTLLPRPLLYEKTFDFSFSGLKAAFIREYQRLGGKNIREDDTYKLAYELEMAVTQVLPKRVVAAIEAVNPKSFLLAGGVAANVRLRAGLQENIYDLRPDVGVFVPEIKYCSDNAAMIGAAALFGESPTNALDLRADPGMNLVNSVEV